MAAKGMASRQRGARERSEGRAAIIRFLLVGLLALLMIAVPISLWLIDRAEHRALSNAIVRTQEIADNVVAPLVTEELRAGEPAAIRQMDDQVAHWVGDRIVRIKLWDADGRVLYSDLPELIGRTYALTEVALATLAGAPAVATFEVQDELENEFEVHHGDLVEVYLLTVTPTGEPVVFEAYFDGAGVRREQQVLLRDTIPVVLVSMAVLQLAQLVPAVGYARRVDAANAGRRRLLLRAVEASDAERRRIARDLHDDVIQNLAGLSYALSAEELHRGPLAEPLLTRTRMLLQENVQTLRSMTSALYPRNLDQIGLVAAMEELAEPLRHAGIDVRLDVEEGHDLEGEDAAVLYRVAREGLTNALKHANALAVSLSLTRDHSGAVTLTIRDDGVGFDPATSAPDGHVGLQVMRDTVEEVGGTLELDARPGGGSTLVARLVRTAT